MQSTNLYHKTLIETACKAPTTSPEKQAGDAPLRFNHCAISQALSNNSFLTIAPGDRPKNIGDTDKLWKRNAACMSEGSGDISLSAKKIYLAKEHNDPVIKSADDQGISANPLFLDDNSKHGRCFNELVRRIKQTQQSQILEMLQGINKEQIGIIIECCKNPTYLAGKHLSFLSSEDFPYVALQAFREEAISLNEFSTLVTVHGVYQENITSNPSFEIHYQRLFDEYGQPLKESWKKIEATIARTDSLRGAFQYDVADCVGHMQECLKSSSPLEAGFWYYTAAMPKQYNTIAEAVRKKGRCRVFSPDEQGEMIPSLTMRQTFVDAAYGDEAHRVNPTIGNSTPLDIRKGGLERYRDFQLPFPGHLLPKIADSFRSPDITGFNLHDYYHALRSSALPNKYVDLYIAMGDEMGRLQKRYDNTIHSLKLLCREKLQLIKLRMADMSQEERQAEIRKVEKEIAPIHKLILSLRSDRKGVGSFKSMLYDLEMAEVNLAKHKPVTGLAQEWSFHFCNIRDCLNKYAKSFRLHLRGITAEIAGRILLPMIPGAKDLPRETYANLVSDLHRILHIMPGFRVIDSDGKIIESLKPTIRHFPYYEDIERTLRFINCINTGDIAATLPQVPGKRP